MGDLLAKNAARKSSDFNAAWPLSDAAQTAPVPMEPPMVVPEAPQGKAPRGRRKGAKVKGSLAPATPNGHIVPTDGRRSRSGRAGRRSLKVLAVVVVVALLGAGGTYFWKQTHKPKSTPTVPAAVASRDPLLRLLVTAVPAGYTVQPDSVGDTGPSDLTKAAHDDGAPDAQAILTATGFLHGYQRMWATADQSQKLVVFIYHFRSAAGATSYVQRMVAAAKATKPAPTSFPVPGIPGALGLTGIDGGTHTAAAVFTQGVYAVQVDTGGPAAGPVVQVAQHIASAQFALLPAG
ncbi:MAG: hypothetical protein QOJ52_147 [Acidimicrobiaceae bacterium]|nr:hypothetical protein [Acidimicrobiaceae bacterium]